MPVSFYIFVWTDRVGAEIGEFSPKVYLVLREGKVADKKQKALTEAEKPWLFNLKYRKIKALTEKSMPIIAFCFWLCPNMSVHYL